MSDDVPPRNLKKSWAPWKTSEIVDKVEAEQRQRWMTRIKEGAALIGALAAGGGFVYEMFDVRVQQQIDGTLEKHRAGLIENEHKRVHEELRHLIKVQEQLTEKDTKNVEPALKDLTLLRKEVYELYRFRAGEKAAELQPDRRKRSSARDRARDKFELYVSKGDTLHEAYIKAIGGVAFF